jgi:hypothetical protein
MRGRGSPAAQRQRRKPRAEKSKRSGANPANLLPGACGQGAISRSAISASAWSVA